MSKKGQRSASLQAAIIAQKNNDLKAQKNKVQTWESLNELRERGLEQLKNAASIGVIINSSSEEIKTKLNEDKNVVLLINVINKDIVRFNERLNEISMTHRGKTGNVKESEYMNYLYVGEHYMNWLNDFTSLVLPNLESFFNTLNNITENN